jgi:hypothetical protein
LQNGVFRDRTYIYICVFLAVCPCISGPMPPKTGKLADLGYLCTDEWGFKDQDARLIWFGEKGSKSAPAARGRRVSKSAGGSFRNFKINNLGAEFFSDQLQDSDRYGEVEAAGAAGAGVEVEDSFFGDVVGDVGVAGEDGGEFGGGGVEVDRFEVVEQVEVAVFEEDDFGFGEFAAGAFAVDVAADGGDGGDGS